MLLRYMIFLLLLVLGLSVIGCAGTKDSKSPYFNPLTEPIRVESPDLSISLLNIIEADEEGTLIKSPGWSEYILEIENHSTNILIIHNVKISNADGQNEEFALIYEQIIVPPNVSVELAGDVAKTAAGVAAGLVVPFGGSILNLISRAISASSASAKEKAKLAFTLRVLKNVELVPGETITGSAFLPKIKDAKTLSIDYVVRETVNNIQVPLPKQNIKNEVEETILRLENKRI
jgi:hypothetical protein